MVEVSSYTYDADGNVLTSTSYTDAVTSSTTTYEYDWRDRLVSEPEKGTSLILTKGKGNDNMP
jgi:YD repeat-containing protein